MSNQLVLVLDFGGQYKELIARRVRECNVYSLIKPGNIPLEEIKAMIPSESFYRRSRQCLPGRLPEVRSRAFRLRNTDSRNMLRNSAYAILNRRNGHLL